MFDPLQSEQIGKIRLLAIDASTVQERGATQTTYRLHSSIDIVTLQLQQMLITDDKTAEGVNNFDLREGDVVLLDRGYNHNRQLVPLIDRGADIILRYNPHGLCLYEREDLTSKINWIDLLSKHQAHQSTPVYLLHEGKAISCWLHAYALSPEQAAESRRKIKATAKAKGKAASAKQLLLAGWVLVLTSIPPDVLSSESICTVYRTRWQIELVFKRMKSLLNIDRLRAKKGSKLAELYLLAKLLYTLVVEKLTAVQIRHHGCWSPSHPSRLITPWRLWDCMHKRLQAELTYYFIAQVEHVAAYLHSLSERPRQRRLQQLPDQVKDLLITCAERGLSYYE
jgi:hypothetical protein